MTAASVGVLSSPASAAPTPMSMSLNSHVQSVHTSSGKKVNLLIGAFKTTTKNDTTPVSMSVSLSTGAFYSTGETHSWSFSVSRASFTYSSSKGHGSLSTGKQIAPLGSMALSFTKTSSSTSKCKVSGSVTTISGRLRGKLHFTSNTKWKNVGSDNFSFTSPNTLTLSNGCNPGEGGGGVALCSNSTSWNGPPVTENQGFGFENGFSFTSAGKTTASITGQRSVTLSKPSLATRQDIFNAGAPAPVVNGNTLTVKTKAGSGVKGSGMFTGGDTTNGNPYKCKSGKNKKMQHMTIHSSAQWSSKAGSPLTFHFTAVPDLVVPASGVGAWYRYTFS